MKTIADMIEHAKSNYEQPDIVHHFGAGVYAKEMRVPKGYLAVSHKHNYDHLSILARGVAMVSTENSRHVYYAPSVVTIRAGVNHGIEAPEDCVWFCIHPTDEDDPAKVDEVAIMKE